MFQSLRQNSQIYIFHKGNTPMLESGTVTNMPIPKPKYPVPPNFTQPQEMVVDITVKIGDRIVNYNGLPAHLDIADSYSNGENIVISDSREAMNAEILSFKQKSIDAINSVDIHKSIINECDVIISNLNPEYAEKKQQQDEMLSLKAQMAEMAQSLTTLTEAIGALTRKGKHNEQNVGNQGA